MATSDINKEARELVKYLDSINPSDYPQDYLDHLNNTLLDLIKRGAVDPRKRWSRRG